MSTLKAYSAAPTPRRMSTMVKIFPAVDSGWTSR